MKKFVVFSIMVLMASLAFAQMNQRYPWASTRDEVISREMSEPIKITDDMLVFKFMFNGEESVISYKFVDGLLTMQTIMVDTWMFNDLATACKMLYGVPTRMGDNLVWANKESMIALSYSNGKLFYTLMARK